MSRRLRRTLALRLISVGVIVLPFATILLFAIFANRKWQWGEGPIVALVIIGIVWLIASVIAVCSFWEDEHLIIEAWLAEPVAEKEVKETPRPLF